MVDVMVVEVNVLRKGHVFGVFCFVASALWVAVVTRRVMRVVGVRT